MFSKKTSQSYDPIIPGLSEEKIKQYAETSAIYQRGSEYFENGAVREVVKSTNQIQAFVSGIQREKYVIKIRFDACNITGSSCSCPYEGYCCKHIVATLLECLHHSENILQVNSITNSLQTLDASQLRILVETLLTNNPDLYQKVMIEIDVLSKSSHGCTHVGANIACDSIIDPKPYKQAIHTAFRKTKGCCYQSGEWDGQDLLNQSFAVIEKAEQFAASNDGNNALLILEAITDECVQACSRFEHIYDDEGEVASTVDEILARLSTAWCEAILTANLSTSETKRISSLMKEWEEQLDCCEFDFIQYNSYYFAPILLALHEGWNDKNLVEVLAGNIKQCVNSLTDEKSTLITIRLKILRRKNLVQEYINLAKYTQFIPELVEVLLSQDCADDAFICADAASMNMNKLLIVAKHFAAAGKSTYAISIACKGIVLEGREHEVLELNEWLSEFAKSCNCHDVALLAACASFKALPSLQRYKRALKLVPSNALGQIKDELISRLGIDSDIYFTAAIDILLYENLIEEAMAWVDKHREFYVDKEAIKKVMTAAISCNPQWVINKGDKYATFVITSGDASRYHAAIDWLRLVHEAYIALDQVSEWGLYLDKLKTQYKSKRKLMALCNEAF